jgi:hypothetical protein
MKAIDLTDKKIGRLTFIKRAPDIINKGGRRRTAWFCNCECGELNIVVNIDGVRTGNIRSCGCIANERIAKLNLSHGASCNGKETREYKSWQKAKERCYNINSPKYKNYGGRGISMCAAWKNNFAQFLKDMGSRPNGLTLERINVDGNYEPSNCRWASKAEQSLNKTNSRFLTHNGKTQNLCLWAKELKIDVRLLHSKLKKKSLPEIIQNHG